MRVLALQTFVLPGGATSEQGEVYDLPDHVSSEAIGMGLACPFVEEPTPTKPKKKGAENAQS